MLAPRFFLALSVLALLALALIRCLDVAFNHDEHQFIAPAVLTARQGLLPYRDYTLVHQPYPILLNAAAIALGSQPLLTGRLISGLACAGTLIGFFFLAWFRLRERATPQRFLMAWSGVLLLLGSSVFDRTTGKSWNHDLPTFMALAALLLAVSFPKHWSRWLVVGILGGLAVGTRMTFAPFALMLAFLPWLPKGWPTQQKMLASTALCAGTIIILLPSLWFSRNRQQPTFLAISGMPACPTWKAPGSSPPDRCRFI